MTVTESANRFVTRPKRVLAGATTVTPIDPIRLGSGEIVPRTERFWVGHPVVRANPELFIAADREDTLTRDQLRAQIKRTRTAGVTSRGHTTRRPATSRPRLLPTARQSWRLP
jgi:hypothetical protein